MNATEIKTLALASSLLQALERGDKKAFTACWSPDAVVWHSFDCIELTVDATMGPLDAFFEALSDRHYMEVRFHSLEGGFVQQYTLIGRLKNGDELIMPGCMVCQVEGGKIIRMEEYLDSVQLQRLQ